MAKLLLRGKVLHADIYITNNLAAEGTKLDFSKLSAKCCSYDANRASINGSATLRLKAVNQLTIIPEIETATLIVSAQLKRLDVRSKYLEIINYKYENENINYGTENITIFSGSTLKLSSNAAANLQHLLFRHGSKLQLCIKGKQIEVDFKKRSEIKYFNLFIENLKDLLFVSSIKDFSHKLGHFYQENKSHPIMQEAFKQIEPKFNDSLEDIAAFTENNWSPKSYLGIFELLFFRMNMTKNLKKQFELFKQYHQGKMHSSDAAPDIDGPSGHEHNNEDLKLIGAVPPPQPILPLE